jgi:membrane associated rhomboid family serine protease/Tfp pilus assembly protein PilF
MFCPRCGTRQPQGASCSQCGIIVARYQRQQAARAPSPAAGGAADPPERAVAAAQDDGWLGRLFAHLARHQEQAFLLKAFAVIVAIISLRALLGGFILFIFLFFPLFFLAYIRLQAGVSGRNTSEVLAEHITFMPVMYAEGERQREGTAWVTYGLILANILIFYGFELTVDPQLVLDHLIFLPMQPNAWNVPVSALTALFLHADGGHLWGNMLFLWAVGTVVERRIGPGRFLLFYLLSGLLAGALSVLVERTFLDRTAHGLGASGAIAGIMGVFAVRCYFKSMVFPVPILGIFSLILPVSLKVRLNSLVIIGLFFLADLQGGIVQLTGTAESMIGHWAHIGGMLCGIGLAAGLRLGVQAVEERHLEIGARAVEGAVSLDAGEESLRLALRQNPQNAEALLLLARIQSKHGPSEEGGELYRRVIALLVKTAPPRAAELFREYHALYLSGVEPVTQYRLAGIFYQQGELEPASRCLELLARDAATPPALRERSIRQCARVLEEMERPEAAAEFHHLLIRTFPESPGVAKAKARLATA